MLSGVDLRMVSNLALAVLGHVFTHSVLCCEVGSAQRHGRII